LSNIKALFSISLLLLLGRLTGFLRDWLIIHKIGANIYSDFTLVLITIPDLMVSLLIGGGFAASVIPKLKSLNENDAFRFFINLFLIIFCLFSFIAFILSLNTINFLYLLAPGIPEEFVIEHKYYFWLTTIAIPLTACGGIMKAKLDSYNLFLYGAMGTLLFNISIIGFLYFSYSFEFVKSVTIGILAGAFLRFLFQLSGILQIHRPVVEKNINNSIDKSFLASLFQALTFSSILFILPIISRSIASSLSEGSYTLFNLAYLLNELPIAIIFGAFATILLTRISELHNEGNKRKVSIAVSSSIRMALLISFSISIPTIFYSSELTEFIFSSTNLTEHDMKSVSQMVMISYFFLPFRVLISLMFPILSSIKALQNLFLISSIILITLLTSSQIMLDKFGLNGVMFSYGIANLVGAIAMIYLLNKKFGFYTIFKIIKFPITAFLIPSISSILINYIGTSYFSGTYAMIFFGLFSAVIFFLVFIINDKNFLFQDYQKTINKLDS